MKPTGKGALPTMTQSEKPTPPTPQDAATQPTDAEDSKTPPRESR
jgi:hypothetical protein